MTAKEDIEGALLDVRKAYRLLYLYQQRVLDLCKEVVAALNTQLTTTLGFKWWQPCRGKARGTGLKPRSSSIGRPGITSPCVISLFSTYLGDRMMMSKTLVTGCSFFE